MPPVEIWLGIIKTQWIPIMVNIKIPGGPPLSSSLIRSIYCLPPSSNPYYGQYIICWWLLCSSSLIRSIYCLPPSSNPYYGQYIIYWWLWCHYTAVFILCRPCYGQFIITWGLQRHYAPCCGQYNLFWGLWQQYLIHIVHIHVTGYFDLIWTMIDRVLELLGKHRVKWAIQRG